MQQTKQAYLVIQLGNRWTDVLRLQPGQPVVVGRSSECQIVVRDEKVSRKHTEISPHEGGWQVRDLGSRNGTQLDTRTLEQPHQLSDGETIRVGDCAITYSLNLASGFPSHDRDGAEETLGNQQTAEIRPTIVSRLSNSHWSSSDIGTPSANPTSQPSRRIADDTNADFFYRLVFDLVACESPEAAAQVALDHLLDRLQLAFGGVVTIEQDGNAPDTTPAMAVLATRQPAGGSYHRVSDFLVATVAGEKQAVLARNVQDDSKLSVARASGQREVVSMICAPLRGTRATQETVDRQESQPPKASEDDREIVVGLLHVYSAGDERMLAEADLELAVGVADNLAIALTRQNENRSLENSLESSRRHVDQLKKQLDQSNVMIGSSPELAKVRQAIHRAGPTDATVLVRGESGVGKELVARAIHSASKRCDGPLVCLNCAALAPTLLESELFGHEKGAFTGATERKLGKFEAANGGTLLLDEIGEMPTELQAKFLRVLEGQPFERLGGNKAIKTNVRIIAATNRALEEAVEAKEFRADLYYRLRVIEIDIPPLRKRIEDVPELVEHFLDELRHHAGRRLTGVSPAAMELLTRHAWPGNIRELRNVIERGVVLGNGTTIEPDELNLSALGTSPESARDTNVSFVPLTVAELEKAHILAMLEHTGGNKTKASQLLGIERSTLDRKLKKYREHT